MDNLDNKLKRLNESLEGCLKFDVITRTIYSTDASVYKEVPAAVAWPKNEEDIRKIIMFANAEKTGVTLRAAGTSLAGQVVSSGIVVDISRHMTKVIEINQEERWARVQPGVVLDELNLKLKEYGLFFGPETSTANRCNIGGMAGNNACGLHSVIYGSTRDHTKEMKVILSDGSEAVFGVVDKIQFDEKCSLNSLEGDIYRNIKDLFSDQVNKRQIADEYPDPKIPRRNTGYALDLLLNTVIFTEGSARQFNFCDLLTGSEGTLAVTTEIKLNLVPLPPPEKALVCIHLKKRNDAFRVNLIALKYNPSAVEMMDDRILELTKENLSQQKNRFFVEGEPAAIVIVELNATTRNETDHTASQMIEELKASGYGYSYPVVRGKDISRVWELRKAGLGVLSNMKGDAKPVSLIEDTAIAVELLPDYIDEFEKMLAFYGKDVVYHAHIGTGELHMRPVLNLKDPADADLFRTLGLETAKLVKKFKGSMSGEHGDGRLRGEFIPIILGEHNYELLKRVKKTWDPFNILNPGKITNTPPMNQSLRYIPGVITPDIETHYDFSSTEGIIRATEKCNGSGDCRKSEIIGGVMCPSFMATRDEKDSTRARANILREFLSKGGDNPWDHNEIYEILDLCLSCKGCKKECPSGVDMAKLKSEFLQHWYDKHGAPIRARLVAYISEINSLVSLAPGVFNFFVKNKVTSLIIKRITGFAEKRSIPRLYKITLKRWIRKNLTKLNPENPAGTVCLFIDEFTNYNDTETGIKVIRLLTSLNYKVIITDHEQSARTFISKGFLRKARKIVRKNIQILSEIIKDDIPLIGIEPSGILGFRDEYPDLAGEDLREKALKLANNSFLLEEFIVREFRSEKIRRELFTDSEMNILLHAHCQQKAVASSASTIEMLSIPLNYKVKEIPSGCCGMAGSFGYEKEHFDLSNKVGEMVLFPEIRKSSENTVIAAPGTSCRHHIFDGTGKSALHPAEILYGALLRK
jgi:FAD/FMN-containing dehydrogenase/Fe-S oxidoreductase